MPQRRKSLDIPPLNPLRVFEAAARHVHFTRAAQELGITQAAVSRQIASLERWLNVKLFERKHTELRLTTAGTQYLESLRPAFQLIGDSTAKILSGSVKSKIVVRSYATFALFWLLPRLGRFQEQFPDIAVDVLTSFAPLEFQPEEADLIIRHGVVEPNQGIAERLFNDVLAPVCSPKLLQHKNISHVSDLGQFTLLHSRYSTHDWQEWLNCFNAEFAPKRGLVFGSSILTYEAAKEGLGVAMGQLRLLEANLNSGILVAPLNHSLKRASGFFLIRSKRAIHDERIARLHDWILEEGRASDTRVVSH